MSNFDNNRMTIWLVQLGKLFYAGGLTRRPYDDESFSFEFVKDEKVAFCILFEEVAERIAEKCGGVVVKRELSSKELSIRSDKHDTYMSSEGKVVEEARKQALMEYVKEQNRDNTKQDKMVETIKESFLLPLIHQGMAEFEYSNAILYAGIIEEDVYQVNSQPEKETVMELVQKIAELDNQRFNWSNSLVKVIQHPAIYMEAKLDTFQKGELSATILIKKEYF